jgi:hypothetical protein
MTRFMQRTGVQASPAMLSAVGAGEGDRVGVGRATRSRVSDSADRPNHAGEPRTGGQLTSVVEDLDGEGGQR